MRLHAAACRRSPLAALALSATVLSACFGKEPTNFAQDRIELTLSGNQVLLAPGETSQRLFVSVIGTGSPSDIEISVSGLPSGVTVEMEDRTQTFNTVVTALVFTAAAGAQQGAKVLTIRATGLRDFVATASLVLTVGDGPSRAAGAAVGR